MRGVLILALMILAITIAMEVTAAFAPRRKMPNAGLDGGLTITAVSKGSLLAGPRTPWSEISADAQIRLGPEVLGRGDRSTGLRLAVLRADFGPGRHGVYDVAGDEEARVSLTRELEGVRPGEVIVFAHRGRLQPVDVEDPSVGELSGWLARVGATTAPLTHEPVSWALIARRERRGWSRLAEAISEEVGVSLTFTLDRDVDRPWRSAGEVVHAELEGRVEVRLDHELASATAAPGVRAVPAEPVGNVRLAGLLVPAAVGGPALIAWNELPLGPGPRFSCGIGLQDGDGDAVRRARFELWVDGEPVHTAVWGSEPGLRPRWSPWDVDLAAYAGRRVRLELRFETAAAGECGLWALPRILYGPSDGPE